MFTINMIYENKIALTHLDKVYTFKEQSVSAVTAVS